MMSVSRRPCGIFPLQLKGNRINLKYAGIWTHSIIFADRRTRIWFPVSGESPIVEYQEIPFAWQSARNDVSMMLTDNLPERSAFGPDIIRTELPCEPTGRAADNRNNIRVARIPDDIFWMKLMITIIVPWIWAYIRSAVAVQPVIRIF